MDKNISIQLNEMYNSLIELGVIFYFGSNSVEHGEITNINFNEDDTIDIEIDEEFNYKISYEDFYENHSKEGSNYHTWALSREFDSLILE